MTAAPHQSGKATIDVKVSDGTAEAHETFKVIVLQATHVTTAVDDRYTLGSLQSLTVPYLPAACSPTIRPSTGAPERPPW